MLRSIHLVIVKAVAETSKGKRGGYRLSQVRTTVVGYEEFSDLEFRPPSRWFVVVATPDVVFIHCRSRHTAQEWVNANYGKGKYTVRSAKLG